MGILKLFFIVVDHKLEPDGNPAKVTLEDGKDVLDFLEQVKKKSSNALQNIDDDELTVWRLRKPYSRNDTAPDMESSRKMFGTETITHDDQEEEDNICYVPPGNNVYLVVQKPEPSVATPGTEGEYAVHCVTVSNDFFPFYRFLLAFLSQRRLVLLVLRFVVRILPMREVSYFVAFLVSNYHLMSAQQCPLSRGLNMRSMTKTRSKEVGSFSRTSVIQAGSDSRFRTGRIAVSPASQMGSFSECPLELVHREGECT